MERFDTDIRSMLLQELEAFVVSSGEKSFRARQLFEWFHLHGVYSYDDMSNLPVDFRNRLKVMAPVFKPELIRRQVSRIDGTRKYLFSLSDGQMVETVLMKYRYGYSVCVSSQVGCKMGCKFCASTKGGLIRSLKPSEILDQVYMVQSDLSEKISHVVMMGMGEPLDNMTSVLKFIRLLSDPCGQGLSQRNFTISTCGIVPQIYSLADEHLQVTLAVSLHAPNDDIRRKIMPAAHRYPMKELIKACKYYFEKTHRRITFEYALIKGVNDSERDAKELAIMLKELVCHVNLIPVNPINAGNFEAPGENVPDKFKNKLEKNRINVTIRREMGRDIDGACGQLRNRAERET